MSSGNPGILEYTYEICAKKILGVCVKRDMATDTYDLNDANIREKLIDMDFVCKVRSKF